MLVLIIPKKESCTSTNVDVYLQPLIEELQVLQKGVDAFDACFNAKFNFETMCIWIIHDFPTYGLFVGCLIKRHVGCPLRGLAIEVQSSKKLKNLVFCGACKYLPRTHPYRQATMPFNGKTKNKVAPIQVIIKQIIEAIDEKLTWVSNARNKIRRKLDPIHKTNIK
jgi:hypothetical protein